MTPMLEIVGSDIEPKVLTGILQRDGAAIVEDALAPATLSGINSDVDDVLADTAPGLRHPTSDYFVGFYGSQTIRLDGLPAKSRTFLEVMQHPLMTKVADELLLPNCEDYLLNTGQLIQIGPGESAQPIHRDEDAWRFFKEPKPLLEVEATFALSDFTIENVKNMPVRCQELLGYKAHEGIGVVDVGSPMKLLAQSTDKVE